MTIALLCSGQGHQGPGMFDLVGHGPDVAPLFSHASRWFGSDPRDWVRSASDEQLRENAIAQVLCTLHTLAAFAHLAPILGRRCCVAGYSVGEVAAWHVAGRIGALDALDLTVARASAMNAASTGQEGMLFVRGVNRRALDALCAGRDAAVAIINPGDAYVLAGTADALSAIALDARQAGAARIVPVPVRVASHTSRLAAAVPVFRRALDGVSVSAGMAGRRLVSGIDGAIVLDKRGGLDRLARQIAEPVDWSACLQACDEAGASAFLELGPGRALSQMAADAYPLIPSRSIADFRSWEGVHAWIARVMQN
ncbi:Malonyl CoA-acyl carrier protein transacylase [Paraburkholderia hiiakae]|uniref:Malonyl CoA-acyl carrier protein transacylase n=1 Tax=Paraburkholderia hiiakae TaxID=1081782 RepID=A0ABN7IEU0_9BURK|nr:malonate decarboxylase subunit epsilon [Paraburkholderia hiiakae]CAD6559072.1 Malonyl CoA-acyl carrier protein transacylase [Paraburkholderia hiiakae]